MELNCNKVPEVDGACACFGGISPLNKAALRRSDKIGAEELSGAAFPLLPFCTAN